MARPERRETDSGEWIRTLKEYLFSRQRGGPPQFADVVAYWNENSSGTDWRQLRAALAVALPGAPIGPPPIVGDFLAKYARAVGAKRILDPFASSPFLVAGVLEDLPGGEGQALVPSEQSATLGLELVSSIEWAVGHPPHLLGELRQEFDFIVSSPPLGMRGDERYPVATGLGEYAYSLLVDLAPLVTPGGKMALLLPDGFLFREGVKVRESLADFGLFLEAAVSVEHGLHDREIKTHLFVFTRREPDSRLFIARLGEGIDVGAIVRNLIEREAGAALELGWLYEFERYRGWAAASAERELLEAFGYSKHPIRTLGEITSQIGRRKAGSAAPSNAVYLPEWPGGQATTTPPKDQRRNVFRLVIDPDLALADYVAGWFNEPLGQTARRAYSAGATVERISLPDVAQLYLLLPPLEDQAKIIRSDQELRLIRREISQRRSDLWQGRVSLEETGHLVQEIAAIRGADETRVVASLEQWIEQLPFPLASIAYDFHAVNDTQVQVDRLQHLFEAFAIFGATILFSAVRRDEALYQGIADKLRRAASRRAILDRADYST